MVGEYISTFVLFTITVGAIPLLTFSYIYLHFFRKIWLGVLSLVYPELDFVKEVTIRSLLDTPRNQGIITVLLCVKGTAQIEDVKQHLQEVVNRKNKHGDPTFPRLKQSLVTKCGTYAWQNEKFDINQNVMLAPNIYKGRPVTEYNIQDYVSEIVAKYLPTGISPWQFIIINTNEDYHYILLKIHHVILSEGLNIGDLLPILPPTRTSIGFSTVKRPLVNVFKTPVAIPKLVERLTDETVNTWNEFIANFDPLERAELMKYNPTFPRFIALIIISFVATIRECKKGFNMIKSDTYTRIKYIIETAKRETKKRQVNVTTLISSILVSLDPRKIVSLCFTILWNCFIVFPFRCPIVLYDELQTLYNCINLQYCTNPHTVVGFLYTYVPLFYDSLKEILYIVSIIITAPKTILYDILLQKESLETITLCGRKCVAWSDPVSIQSINTLAAQTSSSGTEIMLSAVSMCLSNYFTQIDYPIPKDLALTIRNISSSYIYATGPNIRPEDSVSGMLCLSLSLPDPSRETSDMENLLEVKNKLNVALEKQGLSHLLTMFQTKFRLVTKFLPSTFLGIYLKFLSAKYSISVTEVTSRYPHVSQRTLWGKEVQNIIYWRPPQANTSISLCLNEYADDVRLGVMCDAQLMPHHTALVRGFPQYIQHLKRASEMK